MSRGSWIGQKLSGRYRIDALLGQGGMSSVYRATDSKLKRTVALKVIHPHLSADSEFLRRFQVEASAVAQLRHPHIVQVYDFVNEADLYFIVLEFIPGEALDACLQALNASGQRLTTDSVLKIGIDLCGAVDYAHEAGLIHRDIKPANVMLTPQGQAILADFGIAKIVGARHHTATGAVIGTPNYMAPEAMRGQRVDKRADLYSLGVMLFELVSGRPPFVADLAMAVMMMHVNEPVPDLRELDPAVPEPLVQVINRALAKEPDRRYQDAKSMGEDLRQITADDTLRKERMRSSPAARVDIATASALASTFIPRQAPREEGEPAPSEPARPRPGRAEAETRETGILGRIPSLRGRRIRVGPAVAGLALLVGIGFLAYSRALPRAFPETTQPAPAAPVVAPTFPQEQPTVAPTVGPRATPAPSPSTTSVALEVISPSNAARLGEISQFGKGVAQEVVWSPDGLRLAVVSTKGIYLYDAESMEEVDSFASPTLLTAGDYSPDGTSFVAGDFEGNLWLWNFETGSELLESRAHFLSEDVTSAVTGVKFSPDGERLVSGGLDGLVKVWDAATGEVVFASLGGQSAGQGEACEPTSGNCPSAGASHISDLDISYDGERVAALSQGSLRIWDLDTGELLVTGAGAQGGGGDLSFAGSWSDNLGLATADYAGFLTFGYALPRQAQFTLADIPRPFMDVTFSPDPGVAVTANADGEIQFWEVDGGELLATLGARLTAYADGLAFSPASPEAGSGWRLASISGGEEVLIWEEGNDQPVGRIGGFMSPAGLDPPVIWSYALKSPGDSLTLGAGGDVALIGNFLWDTRSGEPVSRLQHGNAALVTASVDPSGVTVASAWDDGYLILSDLHTGETLLQFDIPFGWHLAFASHLQWEAGSLLIASEPDQSIWTWDGGSGEPRLLAGFPIGYSGSTSFSAEGKFVVTTDFCCGSKFDNVVVVRDTSTGSIAYTTTEDGEIGSGPLFGANGLLVYSVGGELTRVVDTTQWKVIQSLNGAFGAFGPDGNLLATVSEGSVIRLWDLSGRQERWSREAYPVRASSLETGVVFSPDGSLLVTYPLDGNELTIWDVATEVELRVLEGNTFRPRAVGFSSDGTRLIVAGEEGTIRVFGVMGP